MKIRCQKQNGRYTKMQLCKTLKNNGIANSGKENSAYPCWPMVRRGGGTVAGGLTAKQWVSESGREYRRADKIVDSAKRKGPF